MDHSGTGTLREEPTRIGRGEPLIVEGIHALNPRLDAILDAKTEDSPAGTHESSRR